MFPTQERQQHSVVIYLNSQELHVQTNTELT